VAADPHLGPHGYWDQLFWHLVDIKYSFRAPLCNSSKCLSIRCIWKSEFGVWIKVECLKVEDSLYTGAFQEDKVAGNGGWSWPLTSIQCQKLRMTGAIAIPPPTYLHSMYSNKCTFTFAFNVEVCKKLFSIQYIYQWSFALGEKQCSEFFGLIGTVTVSSPKSATQCLLLCVWRQGMRLCRTGKTTFSRANFKILAAPVLCFKVV
jgi:hypothetical protein